MTPETGTIFRFKMYDICTDEICVSRRWATREAIQRFKGQILEETATEIDPVYLSVNVEGTTNRDFDPRNIRVGFQTKVI